MYIDNHKRRLEGKPSHSMPGDRPGRARAPPGDPRNKTLNQEFETFLAGLRAKAEAKHNKRNTGGGGPPSSKKKNEDKVPLRKSKRGGRNKVKWSRSVTTTHPVKPILTQQPFPLLTESRVLQVAAVKAEDELKPKLLFTQI